MRSVERLFAGLHAGLQADHVADLALQPLVEADQEIDGADLLARTPASSHAREFRPGGFGFEERAQLARERVVVGERIVLGARLEEKIERIEDRHLGDQIDFHEELRRSVRERPAARDNCPADPAAS